MALTQRDFALQMIAQLRLLDPSVSAEVGTPERKFLDTFAQALYDSQVDLGALQTSLDIDSKYGAQLDRFFGIFSFNRQKPTFATGFVTFSRTTASNQDIRIPAGSTVQAPALDTGTESDNTDIQFTTLFDVTLPAGDLSVSVPIRCALAGTIGNVAINRITRISGSAIFGVTAVTNETPTSGGKDAESDAEFKVRFKNQVFRNLAGTEDQYMALSVSTAFTSKANVVGVQSFYREYVQIPPVDDASAYDVNGDATTEAGGGNAGEYTTALSTIPYAKYIYATEFPVFVSNGDVGAGAVFYRQDTDFIFNWPSTAARNRGDALRLAVTGLDTAVASATNRPNLTFKNIYTGANADVTAVRPGDVLLAEHSYLSEASRNDITNKINNAVDVFIDGGNDTQASTVTVRPSTATAFIDDPNSRFHYENYRRIGQPEKRPLIGNVHMPLFWEPVVDVPDQITVGTVTYFKDVHYWALLDVSSIAGTVRARCGIEWSTKVLGKAQIDSIGDPSIYTGKIITDASGDPVGGQPIEINDYTYDKNIVDLQAALEGAKQTGTDVLAHKAKLRYFKLDVTVMYSVGASVADTNTRIRDAVDSYLKSQFFGSAIQLSDLLQTIHNVSGVDNVRWTSDTPNSPDLVRVFETDANGAPLLDVTADRYQPGNAARPEIQALYMTGAPTAGNFRLSWGGNLTSDLAYNATAGQIQTALNLLAGIGTVTVTEDVRTTVGVRTVVRSFRVTWTGNGAKTSITVYPGSATSLSGGAYIFKNDFFLRDDELARLAEAEYVPVSGLADSEPGLIIRPRAQNTWVRSQ